MIKNKINELLNINFVENLKIFIYCYTLGKEEVFYNLTKDFKVPIIVLKEKFHRL